MTDGQITQVLSTAETRLIDFISQRRRGSDAVVLMSTTSSSRSSVACSDSLVAAQPADELPGRALPLGISWSKAQHAEHLVRQNEPLPWVSYQAAGRRRKATAISRSGKGIPAPERRGACLRAACVEAQPIPTPDPPSEAALDLECAGRDLRTIAERTQASLEAIAILAAPASCKSREADEAGAFSGWGGLSLKAIQDRVPIKPGFPNNEASSTSVHPDGCSSCGSRCDSALVFRVCRGPRRCGPGAERRHPG